MARRSVSRWEKAGTEQTEQEQASASKDKRRCNQRQVAGRRRERTDGAGAGEDKREQELAETDRREQARTSGNRSRQKRASAGRRHFMPSIQQEGRPNGQPS